MPIFPFPPPLDKNASLWLLTRLAKAVGPVAEEFDTCGIFEIVSEPSRSYLVEKEGPPPPARACCDITDKFHYNLFHHILEILSISLSKQLLFQQHVFQRWHANIPRLDFNLITGSFSVPTMP